VNDGYPLTLQVAGRAVVVVGGGAVATRRARGLVTAGAAVTVIAPHVTAELRDAAAAGTVTVHQRPYQDGDLADSWLVEACTDDPTVNAAVAAEAALRRIWCVQADDATASTAWTPATGRVDGLTIAVNAERDPRRASAVRNTLVAALEDGSLATGTAASPRGRVALVGGGPGDPGLLTVRGRRLLADADVVVTDRLGPRALLDSLDADIVDVGKLPRGVGARQEDINQLLIEHARAGRLVVRLKGGDPFVFGRGAEELHACLDAGIPCEVVPGVSSALSVPELVGIPVTHRGRCQHFTVVSGHLPPGDPRSTVDWELLGADTGTLVLMMAVQNLSTITDALLRGGRPSSTAAAVISDGSTPAQRLLIDTLRGIAGAAQRADVRPPAIVVIGSVVEMARSFAAATDPTASS